MKRFLLLSIWLTALLSAQAQSIMHKVALVGGDWETEGRIHKSLIGEISQEQPFFGVAIVDELISNERKEQLSSVGISVEDYIGNNAYYFYINAQVSIALLEENNIRALEKVPSNLKLDPQLKLPTGYPAHCYVDGLLKLNVVTFQNISNVSVEELFNGINAQVIRYSAAANSYRIQLPSENIEALSDLDFVQFVEPIDEKGYPENYKARNAHRIGGLTKTFTGLSNDLDGTGISVMLQDDGVIGPHLDYAGRIGAQYISTNRGDHGDHVGGTIMGAGNLDPLAEGMAPASILYVYGAAGEGYPGFDSISSHYTKHDIKITSTSYSNGQNAGYTSFARELDIQTEQMPALLHVFSAGNAGRNNGGWYNVTGGHKVAKNVLTVANLDYLDQANVSSSRGPARDGRIKPEISAIGTQVWSTTDVNDYTFKTGTSMSCPGVSGTMAVLYQAYKESNNNNYPDAILMKAIACNTADDLGNQGPDFIYGYGRINARKAYRVISEGTHFTGNLENGQSDTVSINIPTDKKLAKVMLAWNDVRGAANANTPLVNNLDLKLIDPMAQVTLPYILDVSSTGTLNNPATNGIDNINNMEQIELTNMQPGAYDLVIQGKAIAQGPQKYHVVYYLESEGIELEYPVGGETFVPGEKEVIRWSTPESIAPFTLEYSLDSGMTWSNIATSVAQQDRYYEWTVPNAFTGKAMIRVASNGQPVASETFTISPLPSGINITKICPDSMELRWSNISGASNYNVYTMGQKYMEIIGTEPSSPFIFKGMSYNPSVEMHFALDAVNGDGTKSRRTKSILKVPGYLNCPLSADIGITRFENGTGSIVDCGSARASKTVSVRIENNEQAAFSNFDIYMQVNGGSVTKETYTGVVSTGQTITYSFTNKATYNAGSNNIKVWLDAAADQNRWNDTIVANVEVYESSGSKPACYFYNVENEANCSTENDCGFTVCPLSDGWINGKNGAEDDIDWRVDAAGTATNGTGPNVDHTLGNGLGKYLYLEASGGCENQEAVLISPCIDLANANSPKLSYWYNMNGQNMGSLHVDIYHNGSWSNDITPVVSGNKGIQWLNNEVDLSAYTGDLIRVRFRGITGGGFRSDMALDDIEFIDKPNAQYTYTHNGNGTVDFQSTTPGGTSWFWLFSNGNTDTSEAPKNQQFKLDEIAQAYLRVVTPCGSDSVELELDLTAEGLADAAATDLVEVFPIPASDQVTIKWSNSSLQVANVFLSDVTGKVVFERGVDSQSNTYEFNVQGLSPGVYTIKIEHSEGKLNKKIVIQ